MQPVCSGIVPPYQWAVSCWLTYDIPSPRGFRTNILLLLVAFLWPGTSRTETNIEGCTPRFYISGLVFLSRMELSALQCHHARAARSQRRNGNDEKGAKLRIILHMRIGSRLHVAD
eukprot:TRINITY_DN29700_c0_g1_i1.p1 TRINITY_DN29700_c0_g1~~TRINITY_DN29700_c0_g1_i1.p1  ORF type:complete len:116 (+),score=2.17 TRINITY_DN29700_c0_g1_i1:215-562(+)